MVEIACNIARDPSEETKDRLRAVEIILSRALPSVHGGTGSIKIDPGTNVLRIEIVDPIDPEHSEVIDITPHTEEAGAGERRRLEDPSMLSSVHGRNTGE